MFSKIAVPLDGSEVAEGILPYVETLAQTLGSDVDLLGVCEPGGARERLCGAYLNQVATQIKAGEAKVRPVVLRGKPAEQIIDYAEKNDTDLIAMTTRGLSGVTRWVVGSVAGKVLGAASVPVLVVRGRAKRVDEPAARAKKILVPLDGSELSETSLPYVIDLATRLGSELFLMRVEAPVAEVVAMGGEAVTLDPKQVAQQRADAQAEATKYLAGVKARLEAKGIKVSTEIREGTAENEIIDFAKREAVDLIAMSTHGHSGLGRWVFGSVSEKVLQGAESPLLLIRPRAKAKS